MEKVDNDVLNGMRSHFASRPSFISRPSHSTSQSVLTIYHWSGTVSYNATRIMQTNLGLDDVGFSACSKTVPTAFFLIYSRSNPLHSIDTLLTVACL
ncbi:hypothetical protein PCASD_20642 [Puccinia coronata f. sp. avenae]|nr:hypothetical protein PCASD_20642 [Puccinia coronata f. sp. avenae]